MTTYRTGNHWGVTIVREGDRPAELDDCAFCCVSSSGCPTHPAVNDQLVAVVVNGDQALAERICALLNTQQALADRYGDAPPAEPSLSVSDEQPPAGRAGPPEGAQTLSGPCRYPECECDTDTPCGVTALTFNPAYRVARCGQQSAHGPHVMDHGPDQPRNCPGTGEVI